MIIQRIRHHWHRATRMKPVDTLPLTISHQRLYIVPSKRGIAFLLALLLMLIASINYALSLGYALCFLLTGLFSASLLHTYSNIVGLTVSSITSKNAFCGEDATFKLVLHNERSTSKQGLNLTSRAHTIHDIDIEPHSSRTVELSMRTDKRGELKLGRLSLQSDWPLGLWTSWTYAHADITSLVYPRKEINAPPPPSTQGYSGGECTANSSQGDVSGLRQYVPGDTLASIAWKSLGRSQELQVLSFDEQSSPSTAHLQLSTTGKTNLEEQLERLCAWVIFAKQQRIDYQLTLAGSTVYCPVHDDCSEESLKALALYGLR